MKVLKGSLYGGPLFASKAPGVCTLSNHAQDIKEVLNPPMTVFQHADWIVESAVWFRAYLYCHLSASSFDCR
jgi:hypothetical protein